MNSYFQNKISITEPDWSRERKAIFEWAPSRSLLASIRSYQKHSKQSNFVHIAFKTIAVLRHRLWSAITGADIPINSHIGGGLLIPHPNGIVIHPEAIIGVNCLILQQVTIGMTDGLGAPRIGSHVDFGAGSKILGAIVIGDHVRIGANAVVLTNLGSHATAVGIPAKVISVGKHSS